MSISFSDLIDFLRFIVEVITLVLLCARFRKQ